MQLLATHFSIRIVLSPWDIIESLVLSRTSISLLTHTYYQGVNHLKKIGCDFFFSNLFPFFDLFCSDFLTFLLTYCLFIFIVIFCLLFLLFVFLVADVRSASF